MNKRMITEQSVAFLIVIIISLFITTSNVHGQIMTQEQREILIDYCYQHADRPNPVDDLIDKAFLPSSFRGETCISTKQAYEKEKNEEIISRQRQQEAINKENQANIDRYHACLQNQTNEECLDILDNNDNTDSYYDCLQNRSKTWEECHNILIGNRTIENS
jgi:hypothetical protein